MQETQASLDDPARLAQAAAVLGAAVGENRLDATPLQLGFVRLRVVRPVAPNAVGPLPRTPALARERRYPISPR